MNEREHEEHMFNLIAIKYNLDTIWETGKKIVVKAAVGGALLGFSAGVLVGIRMRSN